MKLEWTKSMTRKLVVYLLAGIGILLAYFALSNLKAIGGFFEGVGAVLRPFVLAFVYAYLLNGPLMAFEKLFRFVDKKHETSKWRRALAILVTWIVAIAVLVLFFYIIIPDIRDSGRALINNLPGYYESVKNFVIGLMEKYHLDMTALDPLLNFNITVDGVMKIVEQYSDKLLPQIGNIANFSMFIGSLLADILLSLIVSIYFMFSKETLIAQLKKALYALFNKKTVTTLVRIARETHRTFSGFINGKLLDSLIIGILCFIGLSILRFEYPLLISFIVGVTNIIPFFGPIIGAVPSVLILLMVNPWHAFWLAIFILALQQLDGNVIGPKILGDSTGLPALWVMFAILVFGDLFGVLGMFIGVPTFAVMYKLGKELLENRLWKKKMPEKTEDYMVIKGVKEKDAIESEEKA